MQVFVFMDVYLAILCLQSGVLLDAAIHDAALEPTSLVGCAALEPTSLVGCLTCGHPMLRIPVDTCGSFILQPPNSGAACNP